MAQKKAEQKVQDAVLSTIEKLEHHLSRPVSEKEYIHRIRVDIKRLRGWLRVLRYRDSHCDWKITDRHLKNFAKELGGTRDDHVLQETLLLLSEFTNSEKEQLIVNKLRETVHAEITHSEINWDKITNELLNELSQYKHHYVYFKDINTVKKGLRRLYKKALYHGNIAFSGDGDFEELHVLRKWVKFINYQINFVRKAYPASFKSYKKGISKLGCILGQIHDLAVFKDRIKDRTDLSGADELIDKATIHLVSKSKQLYDSLFKDPPKQFIENIK